VEGLGRLAGTQMLRPGFELASPQDMRIPHCVDNAEQAIAIIREHHVRWQAGQNKPA
jgi:hypothetical protein